MPTIHVDAATHEIVRQLAAEMGIPMCQVLHHAARAYWEERFWHEFNAAYARLRADPVAWAEELKERRLFENTLVSGLEDGPPCPEDDEVTVPQSLQWQLSAPFRRSPRS